jgi:EAL domain-containing protein (putative c-di-GMP-specific phosphodiesterase class I)
MDGFKACRNCQDGAAFDLQISMAFQPIVDISSQTIFAYEALVRGVDGQGAAEVLRRVSADNRYAFDQQCRVTAIELAAKLNLASEGAFLSINFLPNAVYEPRACIRRTLDAAKQSGFPQDRIIFEFTEVERLDIDHVLNILRSYRAMGFKTAIDDFGAGFSGLGLLSKFQPDIVKLDMDLIRDIDQDPIKRTIVGATLRMIEQLGIVPMCEGIETIGEKTALEDLGVRFMQGYLFARPALGALPKPDWGRAASDANAARPVTWRSPIVG